MLSRAKKQAALLRRLAESKGGVETRHLSAEDPRTSALLRQLKKCGLVAILERPHQGLSDGVLEGEGPIEPTKYQRDALVQSAMFTISEIEASSKQISKVVGLIMDIELQTNLLALHAGVAMPVWKRRAQARPVRDLRWFPQINSVSVALTNWIAPRATTPPCLKKILPQVSYCAERPQHC